MCEGIVKKYQSNGKIKQCYCVGRIKWYSLRLTGRKKLNYYKQNYPQMLGTICVLKKLN